MLAELVKSPRARSASARKEISNCPSGQQGGNLGQFGRGQMVPEFDAAVFGNDRNGVLPQLVATRYGFHVIRVDHRVAGRALPFEAVRERIARELSANVEARALRQYVEVLAGRAEVHGVDLDAAADAAGAVGGPTVARGGGTSGRRDGRHRGTHSALPWKIC